MRRSARHLFIAIVPLALAACANPTGPIESHRAPVSPRAAAMDEIIPSPLCVSGYNVTQGRCE